MNIKAHIVFDKNKNSLKIYNLIKKNINILTPNKANLFIVIGGDGFMLHSIKKFYKYKKPFYGINSGNYGFLMNRFSKKNFWKDFVKSRPVIINPLNMVVKNKLNITKKFIAINEVSILRQSRQAANLAVKYNKKMIIKKLISDGILISSPAGSTAYNLSVHGPILNLDSKKIAVTPISPFRPRRWKGSIISEKSNVTITNLDTHKRPISTVADNYEVRNFKKVKISVNKKIKFNLLYNKNNSLDKKIKIEQIRREINIK